MNISSHIKALAQRNLMLCHLKGFFYLIAVFCLAFSPVASCAEIGSGSTSESGEMHAVVTDYEYAYVCLQSKTGIANVAQHNMFGIYKGDGSERHHGFYWVLVWDSTGNTDYEERIAWTPSARASCADVAELTDQLWIHFPYNGQFNIVVYPMTNEEASGYWVMDSINYWEQDATWSLSYTNPQCIRITKDMNNVY